MQGTEPRVQRATRVPHLVLTHDGSQRTRMRRTTWSPEPDSVVEAHNKGSEPVGSADKPTLGQQNALAPLTMGTKAKH